MKELRQFDGLVGARVFVAGATTLIGQALVRVLTEAGIASCGTDVPEAAFRDPRLSAAALSSARPTHLIVASGRSGGISANLSVPAELMLDNLRVVSSLIPAAFESGVRQLLYLASSCTYPRESPQPMRPDALFHGPLEATSEAYATAKIAGLVLCQAYRDQHGAGFACGIAGDAYGPGDDFDPEHSHVVAGMIRRMHDARARGDETFTVWGSGRQVRDLVYTDDVARACLVAVDRYDRRPPINLSVGRGTTVADLAAVVRDVVGFNGDLVFDTSRPDGAPMKVLDASVLEGLGFRARTTLADGVARTYRWFVDRIAQAGGCP